MFQSYPWYIADWRASETRLSLTLAQRGLYRELLDYCYMEGSLPEDRKMLLKIAGCSVEAEAEHLVSTGEALPEHCLSTARALAGHCLSTVLALFEHCPSTHRYHHRKVDEVCRKLLIYHEQKKNAGVKSGQSRRERALNVRSTAVEPSPTPAPEPTPEPVKVKPFSPTGVGAEEATPVLFPVEDKPVEDKRGKAWFDASFSRWYQQYWCKTGKVDARKAYEKRIKALVKNGSTHEATEQFLVSEAAEDRKRFEGTDDWDWRVKLHPATWLNGARWEDQPAPPTMSKQDELDRHWGGARASRWSNV